MVDQEQFASLKRGAFKIAATYAVVGFFWIVLADRFIGAILANVVNADDLQFYKNAIYVLVTSCLIYLMVSLHIRQINRLQRCADNKALSSSEAGLLRHRALAIAAIYAGIGLVWVIFSEGLLQQLLLHTPFYERMAGSSGSVYILITSCVVYYLVSIHVHQIHGVEHALDLTRGTLRRVLDLVPHMIYAKDGKGRYVLCNDAFARAHGSTVEDVLEQGTGADSHLTFDELQIVQGENESATGLEDFEDTDGQVRILQTTKVAFKTGRAGPPGVLGISLDVTDRVRAERALFEETERAQVTLHSISDAVISTDAKGIIDYMNPAAEELTGWELQAAKGRSLREVFQVVDPDARRRVEDPLSWALEEGLAIGLLDRNELINKAGQRFAIEDSAAPIRDENGGVQGVVIVFRDVTETRRMARKMFHLATHDPLTGLVNRVEFEQRLKQAVLDARENGSEHVLCYLDLDQFKIVNDTAGHAAGDELLKQLTKRVSRRIRPRDCLARLGGDEFSLLVENCGLSRAIDMAEALIAAVRDFRFKWQNRTFEITVSIGIVPIDQDSRDVEQVMSQGDIACYTAKDLGRNRIHVYQKDDREFSQRHSEILRAAGLSDALAQRRFALYGQPIYAIDGPHHKAACVEVLLRLFDEDHNITMPEAFIPAAERYGVMTGIDCWVVQTALEKFRDHQASSNVDIAINVSGSSLSDPEFIDFVVSQVETLALPAQRICFELTETAAVSNLDRAHEFITRIQRVGCRFALDDFGSGLSSFNYLKNLPVDLLKIDGTFVENMAADTIDHAMVDAINQIGNVMGIQVVAECADTELVVNKLRSLGVKFAQGWYFADAEPLDKVFEKVRTPTPLRPVDGNRAVN